MPDLHKAFVEEYTQALDPLMQAHGAMQPEISWDATSCKLVYRSEKMTIEVVLDIPALDVSVYFVDELRASLPGVWKFDRQGKLVRAELWDLLRRLGTWEKVIRDFPPPDHPQIWQIANSTRTVEACRAWFRYDALTLTKVFTRHGAQLLEEARRILSD